MPRMLAPTRLDIATLDLLPEAAVPPPATERPVRWSLATRLAFRFCGLYFALYVLTTQMLGGLLILPAGSLPNIGATGYLKGLVTWTANTVFRVSHPYVTVNTGSGDKTIDWVQAFCLLALAAAATAVWSALDRRRPNYAALHKWTHLFVRFALGSTMVGYGVVKVIPLQMPAPSLQRLLEPFGHFSPMGVLWYSIGASRAYEIFCGFVELTCGVLLFIPHLSIVGALLTVATGIQIFTLNMTYDVPVKLFSFHIILMALFLLAPEARRLMRVLVLNRAAAPSTQPPLFRRPRARRIAIAVQLVFGAYIVGMNLYSARQSWMRFGGGAPKSPLYGAWNVAYMSIDGVERAPLVTDYDRFRRVVFDTPARMAFQRMDDTFTYGSTWNVDGMQLTLSKPASDVWSATLTFERPADDRLTLSGEIDGRKLEMRLELFPREKFLLVSRGFNWVQEYPFNR